MQVKAFRSGRLVSVPTNKYRVKWSGDCRSKFQKSVKQWLQRYWENHIVVEEYPIPGTRLKLDLVNLTRRIIVETNGKQHNNFVPYFHPKSRFDWLKQIECDANKREWAAANGYIMVEIDPEDMPLKPEFFKDNYDIDL